MSTAEDSLTARQGISSRHADAQTSSAGATTISGTDHAHDAQAQQSAPELGADQQVSGGMPEAATVMSNNSAFSRDNANTARPSTARGNRTDQPPARRSNFCFDRRPAAVQPPRANANASANDNASATAKATTELERTPAPAQAAATSHAQTSSTPTTAQGPTAARLPPANATATATAISKLESTSAPAQAAATGHAQAGSIPATAEGPTAGLPGAALDQGLDASKQPQESAAAVPAADSSLTGVSASSQTPGHTFAGSSAGVSGDLGSATTPFTSGTALVNPGKGTFTSGTAPSKPGSDSFASGMAPFDPSACPFTSGAAPINPGTGPFTRGGAPFTPGGAPFTAPFSPNSAPCTANTPLFNGFQAGAGTAKPHPPHASPSGKAPGKRRIHRGSSASSYTPSFAKGQPGTPGTASQESGFAIGAHHINRTIGFGQSDGRMQSKFGAPGPDPSTDASSSAMPAFDFSSWGQPASNKGSSTGEQPNRPSFTLSNAAPATPGTASKNSTSTEFQADSGMGAVPAFNFKFGQASGRTTTFAEQGATAFTFGGSTDYAAADSWQQQRGE